jgi:lysophospholipase L1-like esterase
MSIERRMVQQLWLGDSHLAINNRVPASYKAIKSNKKEEAIRFRSEPVINIDKWLKGGKRMSAEWAKDVADLIRSQAGTPSCYVLCIGTNNLRDSPTRKTKEDLLLWHKNIIEAVKNTPCAAICIVSPIPDEKGFTDVIGEELDGGLSALCKNEGETNGKIKFVPFRTRRLPHNNGPTRWNPRFFKDDVHLNPLGASMLANEVFNTQTNIKNEVFGLPKDRISFDKITKEKFGYGLAQRDQELGPLPNNFIPRTAISGDSRPPAKKSRR